MVFVDHTGAVLEAQLYWLSLLDTEIVSLRDPADIIADLESDSGFAPPLSDENAAMIIHADDMVMTHVLTRLGDAQFVLQPAIKVVGEYVSDADPAMPGPARYVVAAIDNSD
jgi:hypothetical protein